MSRRGRWTIPLHEVPLELAIHQYILQKTDLLDQVQRFKERSEGYLSAPLLTNFDQLKNSVLEGIQKFGQYQFQYGEEPSAQEGIYLSTSLTWNPDAYDKVSDDPHRATLGSTSLKFNSASRYQSRAEVCYRNSYNDTLAFCEKTPLANFDSICSFLGGFKRTLIRSRISSIVANKEETTRFGFNWHNDESIFINLRINIPIQTSSNYVIQLLKSEDRDKLDIDEFFMEPGYAYVYNTEKYHRAFCKKVESFDRVHMICGVSPWFDFDAKIQSWVSNEYYGEIHPFDMLTQGLISPLIKN